MRERARMVDLALLSLAARAHFTSGKAVNAVIMLAAKRLDDAAAKVNDIAEPAAAQRYLDDVAARAKDNLDDVERELDQTDATATLTPIGLDQLNGALRRLHLAIATSRLGLDASALVPLGRLNDDLHRRLGRPTTGARAAFAEPNRQDERSLLDAAILDNLEAAREEAHFGRMAIVREPAGKLKQAMLTIHAHLQEAYTLMHGLAHARAVHRGGARGLPRGEGAGGGCQGSGRGGEPVPRRRRPPPHHREPERVTGLPAHSALGSEDGEDLGH